MKSRLERLQSQRRSLKADLIRVRELGNREKVEEALARLAELDQAIAEAEGASLTGGGDPRPDG